MERTVTAPARRITTDEPAPAAEIDEVTLVRAQRGDRLAQRALVRRYQSAVFAIVWRMMGSRVTPELVEDLAQDTFVRVFAALPRFEQGGRARLSTWILTIASRRAIDELRRRRPKSVAVDPDTLAAGVATDGLAERRRLAAALEAAIADLAPPYRAAFILRNYHDLDYAEIADALEIDLGTVKSRLARARAALRSKLEEVHLERL